jgi:hypothetical protein
MRLRVIRVACRTDDRENFHEILKTRATRGISQGFAISERFVNHTLDALRFVIVLQLLDGFVHLAFAEVSVAVSVDLIEQIMDVLRRAFLVQGRRVEYHVVAADGMHHVLELDELPTVVMSGDRKLRDQRRAQGRGERRGQCH